MDEIGSSPTVPVSRAPSPGRRTAGPEPPAAEGRPAAPARPGLASDLRDLWAYRELLYFLTWRDVKVRYKQSLLGVAWAIVQPLLMMLVFSIFFGRLAGIPSGNVPYPLFAYAGLVPWVFFSNAVTSSGNSLVANAHLITKAYFPRMIIPCAAVAASFVDFAVAFATLLGLMGYYRMGPSPGILLLPVLVLLTVALALGVGMWLSALNVKYRDVRHALPFLIQLWLFATPIIYPSELAPPRWRWLLALNPLAGLIEGYRSSLFGSPFDWSYLTVSALSTLLAITLSFRAFRRMQKSFADIV